MIWQLWFNLGRTNRKKRYIKNSLVSTERKIWEQEFLKHQHWEVRGGMREQYDWLRERVDGAIRRLAETKYTIFYSENGDEVKVMDLPLPPAEIENLPNKPTEPHRFHKVAKENVDQTVIDELERIITQRTPDLAHQKENLQKIDAQVAQIDGSIAGLFELKASLNSMLNKL